MSTVLRSSIVSTAPNLRLLRRDPLMADDPLNGVRFDFDLAFPSSYGGASPVINGGAVKDLSELQAHGQFVIPAGQAPVFAGRGIDFSTVTARNAYLEMPAAASKAIWDNGQRYLIAMYMKLPALADWFTSSAPLYFLQFGDGGNTWQGGPDIFSLGQATNSGVRQLIGYRQVAAATADTSLGISGSTLDMHLGKFAQVAVWRTATEQGLRVRTDAGITNLSSARAVGAENTQNFSSLKGKIGITPGNGATLTTAQAAAAKWKLYRGFVEALGISGRDPVTVLDADWTRTVTRAAFN